MPVMVIGRPPVLVTVTFCAALSMFWSEWNVRDDGHREIAASFVPVRAIDRDTAGEATFTLSDAVLTAGFMNVGLKLTLTVQVAPDASVAPQVLVWLNWPGYAPP